VLQKSGSRQKRVKRGFHAGRFGDDVSGLIPIVDAPDDGEKTLAALGNLLF